MTAELAIALPALVLLLALAAGVLGALSTRVLLQDAAADAARVVARGEDDARAASVVAAAVGHASTQIDRGDGLVCVTASATAQLVGLSAVRLVARSCALDGGR